MQIRSVAELIVKGAHTLTVPIPAWVKSAVDAWIRSVNMQSGMLFRAIGRPGKFGYGIYPEGDLVERTSGASGWGFGAVAAHNLRRW